MTSPIGRLSTIPEAESINGHSLQTMIQMVLADKLNQVDGEVREEIRVLNDRQGRVEYLDKYLRQINATIDNATGSLNRKHLEELNQEGLMLKDEAEQRLRQAESVEAEIIYLREDDEEGYGQVIAKKEREAKWLRESANEIYDTLKACKQITKELESVKGPKTYIKEDVTRLMENLRSYSKILQTRNHTQLQMVNRANTERNTVLMQCQQLQRTIHEIMKKIASNIR